MWELEPQHSVQNEAQGGEPHIQGMARNASRDHPGKGERKGLRREEQGVPPPPEPAGSPTALLHSPGVGLLSQPSGVPSISESVPTSWAHGGRGPSCSVSSV